MLKNFIISNELDKYHWWLLEETDTDYKWWCCAKWFIQRDSSYSEPIKQAKRSPWGKKRRNHKAHASTSCVIMPSLSIYLSLKIILFFPYTIDRKWKLVGRMDLKRSTLIVTPPLPKKKKRKRKRWETRVGGLKNVDIRAQKI